MGFEFFPEQAGVRAESSCRSHGSMSLGEGEVHVALANRKRFLEAAGMPARDLVCARQVHSDHVAVVTPADKGRGAVDAEHALAETDALITDARGLPIAVFTADCLPVFLYDSRTPAIAVVHAGWRSTQKRIVARTLSAMCARFNTQPSNLFAAFGPAIRVCCYEVSGEMRTSFPGYLDKRGSRCFLDLAGANRQELLSGGVLKDRIIDSGECTCCAADRFFSYRREGERAGRMISVIMLR